MSLSPTLSFILFTPDHLLYRLPPQYRELSVILTLTSVTVLVTAHTKCRIVHQVLGSYSAAYLHCLVPWTQAVCENWLFTAIYNYSECQRGCSHFTMKHYKHDTPSELLGFWILSIIQYSKNYGTQCFGNYICFCARVRGETPILLGPLERDNLNHWSRVCVSSLTWGWKEIHFLRCCVL
jgi:hypothetical protein